MNISDGRTGNGIREFLEYYILVIFDEGTWAKGKITEVIQERSSDNTQYRTGGALRVALVDQIIGAMPRRDLESRVTKYLTA